jgi:hypothetical protein
MDWERAGCRRPVRLYHRKLSQHHSHILLILPTYLIDLMLMLSTHLLHHCLLTYFLHLLVETLCICTWWGGEQSTCGLSSIEWAGPAHNLASQGPTPINTTPRISPGTVNPSGSLRRVVGHASPTGRSLVRLGLNLAYPLPIPSLQTKRSSNLIS